jgi:hypothetical protein
MLFWRLCLPEPQMKAEPSMLHFWLLARNEKLDMNLYFTQLKIVIALNGS